MTTWTAITRIGAGGRIVIPHEIREALEMREGDSLLLEVDDQGLHIRSVRHAVQRAQQLIARHVKSGRSLTSELIAERRKDAGPT